MALHVTAYGKKFIAVIYWGPTWSWLWKRSWLRYRCFGNIVYNSCLKYMYNILWDTCTYRKAHVFNKWHKSMLVCLRCKIVFDAAIRTSRKFSFVGKIRRISHMLKDWNFTRQTLSLGRYTAVNFYCTGVSNLMTDFMLYCKW